MLLTAYADTDVAIRAINEIRLDQYLLKPWDPPEERLYPVLDDLLADWSADVPAAVRGPPAAGGPMGAARPRDPRLPDPQPGALRLAGPGGRRGWPPAGRIARADRWSRAVRAGRAVPDGRVLRDPANRDVADAIGLSTHAALPFYDLVIVGAGPAGLAAAVYGASEGLKTLLVEREAPGGQAGTTSRIENYLGFPSGPHRRRPRAAGADAGAAPREPRSSRPQEATSLRREDPYRIVVLGDESEVSLPGRDRRAPA